RPGSIPRRALRLAGRDPGADQPGGPPARAPGGPCPQGGAAGQVLPAHRVVPGPGGERRERDPMSEYCTEHDQPLSWCAHHALTLLGKRVEVTLDEGVVITGKLLGFGEGGNFEIEEDDGMI